jgi:predicted naringenin-chalcone synthase
MSSSRSTGLAVAGGVLALAGLGALAVGARRSRAKKIERDEAAAAEEKKRPVVAEAKVSASIPLAPTVGTLRNARILSLASAFPPNEYSQTQYLEAFLRNHKMNAEDEDFTRRVWAGTGFNTCSSYLPESELFVKMSRSKYVKYVKSSLKDMARRSAIQALANWGGDKAKLTHIIFGTMTGTIHAPTMDIEIAIDLGLPTSIKRLNVEGMGCLTGYRALGLASDIARADASHLVLLIVCDIRSALGNQLSPHKPGDKIDKSNVIVSSLFRDSGCSAVISSAALATVPASVSKQPLYEIIEHRSHMIPDTFDLVKYQELDDAVIHLYIAKELPGAIKKVLRGQVDALLAPHGVKLDDCSFSVHTGGPKVLEYVAEGLQSSKARMASSWYCMKKWGNLSGSSNLVVLDQWRKLPKDVENDPRRHVVCMSFGPGVGMELLLLRAVAPEVPVNPAA